MSQVKISKKKKKSNINKRLMTLSVNEHGGKIKKWLAPKYIKLSHMNCGNLGNSVIKWYLKNYQKNKYWYPSLFIQFEFIYFIG